MSLPILTTSILSQASMLTTRIGRCSLVDRASQSAISLQIPQFWSWEFQECHVPSSYRYPCKPLRILLSVESSSSPASGYFTARSAVIFSATTWHSWMFYPPYSVLYTCTVVGVVPRCDLGLGSLVRYPRRRKLFPAEASSPACDWSQRKCHLLKIFLDP
jgi:hypothetical protein